MVTELMRELASLEQVEALALGGSRAGEHYDEKSDYDVYLYCTGRVSEDVRRDILKKYCSYMEIGNHFWEMEDNCKLNNGIDLDLLYRNLDEFTCEVASVVEEYHSHNGYTTCMWHNLLTCKIVYDRDGRLAAAKKRFDVTYPKELKKNIIENNMRLVHRAMPAYRYQIEKAVKRGDIVSISHRTAAFMEAYFDVIFALNERTHPGEKRLIELSKEQCSILPADFEMNIKTLFAHLYEKPESVSADLGKIVKELESVLEQTEY